MDDLTACEVEELVARFPLAAGVPDAVVNRSELAEFFDVSMLTISNWITAGMPVKTKGGQGQAYELQLSECWAWKCARDRSEEMRSEQARAAIEAQRLSLVGGGLGESIEALDPKMRREIYAVQREFELLEAQRNSLLWRDEVMEAYRAVLQTIMDTVEMIPDLIEREHSAVPPSVVDTLEKIGDRLIETIRDKLEAWCSERELKPRRQTGQQANLFDDDNHSGRAGR